MGFVIFSVGFWPDLTKGGGRMGGDNTADGHAAFTSQRLENLNEGECEVVETTQFDIRAELDAFLAKAADLLRGGVDHSQGLGSGQCTY